MASDESKEQLEAEEQDRRWKAWKREEKEAIQRGLEFKKYWDRRRDDDRELWLRKDFANAVDKASRCGYHGKHGDFDVPQSEKEELNGLYMQATVGDFDGNHDLSCVEQWKSHAGLSEVEAMKKYITLTNRIITKYGWNPPEGWT